MRVRGQCADVPMAEEGRDRELRKVPERCRGTEICMTLSVEVWTELRKTAGCLRAEPR